MVTAQRVDGVDISHHQNGKLDFNAAKKAGVKWLYHKATEGATYKDANYNKRRLEAKRAKLPFGAYHFARPNANGKDAVDEARFFISVARPVPGDLRPALDLETREDLSGMRLVKWADAFCAEVKRLTGVMPIVYTPYVLSTDLENSTYFWRPRYNNQNTPPKEDWDIWQFSNGVYGKPRSVPGLGNVDLNTSKIPVSRLQIPVKKKPAPKPKKKATLRFAELSLKFNNTPKQIREDLNKLFTRGYDVISGTESGHSSKFSTAELKRQAAANGYLITVPARYDTWVAVKKTLIAKDAKTGSEFVLNKSSKYSPKPPGRWGDKGIVWISWDMGPTYGHFSVGAVHYLAWRGAGNALKKSTDKAYATAIQKWADQHGKGSNLAFIAGDFNLSDKNNDVFLGQAKFKTCWDDLKKWPNTGHGNIDAIARYKPDSRVKCVGARAFNDKQDFFHSDHFLIEAEYEIEAL